MARKPTTQRRSSSHALTRDEFVDALHRLEVSLREAVQGNYDRVSASIQAEREKHVATQMSFQQQIDGLRVEIAKSSAAESRAIVVAIIGVVTSIGVTMLSKLVTIGGGG